MTHFMSDLKLFFQRLAQWIRILEESADTNEYDILGAKIRRLEIRLAAIELETIGKNGIDPEKSTHDQT